MSTEEPLRGDVPGPAQETGAAEPLVPVEPGPNSRWLTSQNLPHTFLGYAMDGVELIGVAPEHLPMVGKALCEHGYNFLRLMCGYDEGAGERLVSVYGLTQCYDDADNPPEVRLKVFLDRDNPRLPSVYWIWKAADWQERETFDLYGIIYEGHPNLIRILNQEDWVGWPMRKDYVTPAFYEVQDAH